MDESQKKEIFNRKATHIGGMIGMNYSPKVGIKLLDPPEPPGPPKFQQKIWNLIKSNKKKIMVISGCCAVVIIIYYMERKSQKELENKQSLDECNNLRIQQNDNKMTIVSKPDQKDHRLDPSPPSTPPPPPLPSPPPVPVQIVIIKQLLENSSKQRNIEQNYKYYLIETLEKQEFFNNYSIRQLEKKKKLEQYCTKMIHVRGDGNNFYTSFGYQFLKIVIYQYSDQEFNSFLNQNFTIPFKIFLHNQRLGNDQDEEILLNHFKDRIIYLRNLEKSDKLNEHYQSQLWRHFRAHEQQDDLDGYFQPLKILFLRNLCMHLVENSEDGINVFDQENLLKWEEECNCNEQVIAILAKHFKIHIQLVFITNEDIKILEYSKEYENNNRTIILLIKPGHYNIGLKS